MRCYGLEGSIRAGMESVRESLRESMEIRGSWCQRRGELFVCRCLFVALLWSEGSEVEALTSALQPFN
jgi:hypothetical protein